MTFKWITLMIVVLMMMGCVNSETPRSSNPSNTTNINQVETTSSAISSSMTTSMYSTSSSVTTSPNMSDKGPIPNVGVNVYHVTNDQTCEAALSYIAQEPKLAYLMNPASPNRCYPMKYGLQISVGSFSYIEIRENDNNDFYYSFSLSYRYRLSYTKENKTKQAEFVVSTYESRDITNNEPYLLYLSTNSNFYNFIYDEEANKFFNTSGRKYRQELVFTSDLTIKMLDAYEQAKSNMIGQVDSKRIADDMIDIIKRESKYSSTDIADFKKIDEVDFDRIYPFFRKGYVYGSDYSIIDDYFVIEKNGKYGLVNNNGIVVSNMVQNNYLFLMHGNEIYFHSAGDGLIPFTTYYFGGSHGIGGSLLFYDLSLNRATEMGYGDDGPGSYRFYQPNIHDVVPILPYQLVDECKWNDDYSCSLKNRSTLYGLLSHQGDKLTEPLYTSVLTTRTSLIAVACNDKWGYVNHEGKQVIDCMYEGIWQVNDQLYPYPPIGDYIIVKNQNGKFGVIDFDGKTLIPFEYDVISPYYDSQIIMRKGTSWTQRKME